MSTTKPSITIAVDTDGIEIVRVPLANSPHAAVLYRSDYQAALEAGLSPRWFLNDNGRGYRYVRANGARAGNLIGIARVIAGAGRRETVEYVNGDRLNLRRENLRVMPGGHAKRADATLLGRELQAGDCSATAA